jgi:hypothetical protein
MICLLLSTHCLSVASPSLRGNSTGCAAPLNEWSSSADGLTCAVRQRAATLYLLQDTDPERVIGTRILIRSPNNDLCILPVFFSVASFVLNILLSKNLYKVWFHYYRFSFPIWAPHYRQPDTYRRHVFTSHDKQVVNVRRSCFCHATGSPPPSWVSLT